MALYILLSPAPIFAVLLITHSPRRPTEQESMAPSPGQGRGPACQACRKRHLACMSHLPSPILIPASARPCLTPSAESKLQQVTERRPLAEDAAWQVARARRRSMSDSPPEGSGPRRPDLHLRRRRHPSLKACPGQGQMAMSRTTLQNTQDSHSYPSRDSSNRHHRPPSLTYRAVLLACLRRTMRRRRISVALSFSVRALSNTAIALRVTRLQP